MKRLEGKTAVITGAAQGIGRAVAEKFAQEGCRVAIVDLNRALAEETAAGISGRFQVACSAFYADLSQEEDIFRARDAILSTFGRVDVLVNHAGIQPTSQPFWEVEESSWDGLMNIDLKSVFLFSKAMAPVFLAQGSGCIVNTSSVAGLYLWNQSVPYIAAKAAIIEMTQAMAYELADFGIRVNAVAPGHVDTALNAASLSEAGGRVNRENQVPLRRLALPEDLAGAYVFAASDQAGMMSGATIYVDGGLTQIK